MYVHFSEGRSGSTLLGELFRMAGAFYLYEPCRRFATGVHNQDKPPPSLTDEDCAALVLRLLDCTATVKDVMYLALDQTAMQAGSLSSLLADDEPLWHELHEDEFRGRLRAVLSEYRIMCARAQVRVAKVIRLRNGIPTAFIKRSQSPGTEQARSSLLMVHLVRDPRAVANSLAQPEVAEWFGCASPSQCATRACAATQDKLRGLAQLPHDAHHVLRFEDFVVDPLTQAAALFAWANIGPLPTATVEWLRAACGTSTYTRDVHAPHHENSTSVAAGVNDNLKQGTEAEGAWGTIRADSTSVATRWQHELDRQTILAVQDACSSVMQVLNYSAYEAIY
eukprot:TRINITY_DN2496_c0_g1_i2.p1 TRINITY_DN2496_c0_g1~~TRINITY_DN2496_c0_g1_i2.p1  ORF type:complete len:356 (+),score=60.67 TRINITY_DN2496_c0_g1_i2:59-1069(+)